MLEPIEETGRDVQRAAPHGVGEQVAERVPVVKREWNEHGVALVQRETVRGERGAAEPRTVRVHNTLG